MHKQLFACLATLCSGFAFAGEAMIRLKCDETAAGGKVYINNQLKGECPLQVLIPEGSSKLRVVKSIDTTHDGVFEKDLFYGDGAVDRINVVLTTVLNEEGRRQQAEAEAAEARRQAEWKAHQVRQEQQWAEQGDRNAMARLIDRYKAGDGVEKSEQQAEFWNQKLATAILKVAEKGDLNAMYEMKRRYKEGDGVEKDLSQVSMWEEKLEAQRIREEESRRKAQKQARLGTVNYTKYTDLAIHEIRYSGDPLYGTWATTIFLPGGISFDLTSSPFRSTETASIYIESAMLPSVWAKPDSMIAKAAVQEHLALAQQGN